MSDEKLIGRRSVLKSTGVAVAGMGAVGTASARREVVEGTISLDPPYVNNSVDIDYRIVFGTCEFEVDIDVEGAVSENFTLTCSNASRSISFDVGPIDGEVKVEADFTNNCATVSAEGCVWHFTGWSCVDDSETVCA